METYKGNTVVKAGSRKAWRQWLQKNHQSSSAAWLVIYHKKSEQPSVYHDEAVEEALCFGWIDSVANKRDAESKYQFFSQRKPGSNWSNVNKERAERMLKVGLVKPAGQKMIDLAKASGTWDALTDIQNGVIPGDLQKLLNKNRTAAKHFAAFSPSSRRIILEWIQNAKRPETRQRRLKETVEKAAENIRANHFIRQK